MFLKLRLRPPRRNLNRNPAAAKNFLEGPAIRPAPVLEAAALVKFHWLHSTTKSTKPTKGLLPVLRG